MNEFRFFRQQIRPIVFQKKRGENEVKKTTHQLVRVGRYGRENRLGKDVGAELAVGTSSVPAPTKSA